VAIVGVVSALSAPALGGGKPEDSPSLATVVFICEHGSSKSLVATALFNRIAEQRGIPLRALSRAVSPETVAQKVPARLVRSMAADGFQVEAFRPQAVTSPEIAGAARVIVIGYDGQLRDQGKAPVERWNDVPPPSRAYDDATTTIISHIELLFRELADER